MTAHLQHHENPTKNKPESLCTLLDEDACANSADGSKREFVHVDGGLWGRRKGHWVGRPRRRFGTGLRSGSQGFAGS